MSASGARGQAAGVSADIADIDSDEAAPRSAPAIRPSWVNWLIDRIDGLPFPPWVTYTAITAAFVLLANLQVWTSGLAPTDRLDPLSTYYGILTIAPLWIMHYLDGVARASMATFRPALDCDDATVERLTEELTVVPARPAAVLAAAGVLLTYLDYVVDPVGTRVSTLSPLGLVARAVGEGLVAAFLVVLLYHTVRQLRAVSRVHALAARVDLLRPAPLYAFSRLTVRTAIGIVAVFFSSVVIDPTIWTNSNLLLIGPWIALGIVVPLGAFVLPLRGIHDRIAAEKAGLLAECGRRITDVTAIIHRDVGRDDLARADGLNKMLLSLIAERELLTRLPTWPWQPGTVGAFVTAAVLPLVLFAATRLGERFL